PGRVALILLHILLIISRAISGLVDLFQVFPVSLFLIWHYRWGGRHFPDFFHTGDAFYFFYLFFGDQLSFVFVQRRLIFKLYIIIHRLFQNPFRLIAPHEGVDRHKNGERDDERKENDCRLLFIPEHILSRHLPDHRLPSRRSALFLFMIPGCLSPAVLHFL